MDRPPRRLLWYADRNETNMRAKAKPQPVLIKRYARDRLYDTRAGFYVTVAVLRRWAERAIPFHVVDAETGEDITRILMA
jgi:polyhydroxyalkanoate synthesis regulator protein